MVAEYFQPDAVFDRLKQAGAILLTGSERPHGYVHNSEAGAARQIYPDLPVPVRPGNAANPDPPVTSDSLELDLGLFRVYYLDAIRLLGEKQLAVYTSLRDNLIHDYQTPARKADFVRRTSELASNYMRLLEIYDWYGTSSHIPDRERVQYRRQLLDETGIILPPNSGSRSGRPNRARPQRSPFTGMNGAQIMQRIARTIVDYQQLLHDFYRVHPLFVFVHKNRSTHQIFSSLAINRPSEARYASEVESLIRRAISEISRATQEFGQQLQRGRWFNLLPLLSAAKVALFGQPDEEPQLYELARVFDRDLTREHLSTDGITTALIVVGVIVSVASGGTLTPFIVAMEAALGAAYIAVDVTDYLHAEQNNIERRSAARLELINGGIQMTSDVENLEPRLWMMVFAAPLSTIAFEVVGAGLRGLIGAMRSRITQRASAAAAELVTESGLANQPARQISRDLHPATRRPASGRPHRAPEQRATGRRRTPSAEGERIVSEPSGISSVTNASERRALQRVNETTLEQTSEVITSRTGTRLRYSSRNGVKRLWRCAD